MAFREATLQDIPQIQMVRHAVKENILSDPALVSDEDCANYLERRGMGWVCVNETKVVGFAIADLTDDNIWALFVDPQFEHQGIGRKLHDLMLDWYFSQGKTKVWLGTSPNTRASQFYKKAGWQQTGLHGKNEIKFEMQSADWLAQRRSPEMTSS